MKSFKGILIVFCFILLIGCGKTDNVVINSSTEDIQEFIDEQNTGFIIITNETNASFLDEVQTALLEKQQTAKLFNVFYNDGKNKNLDGLTENPFSFEMSSVNSMYYIKNGKVFDEYNLEKHKGLQQEEGLHHFLDANKRVTQNE